MNFKMISCDPNGVYVGLDTRGWLWYWIPQRQIWMVLYSDESGDKLAS